MSPRAVVTTLLALLVIPAVYALMRCGDVLFGNEPNPASVTPGVHIAMFWRVGIGSYVALGLAPLLYRATEKEGMAEGLLWALPIVGGLLLLQALFLP